MQKKRLKWWFLLLVVALAIQGIACDLEDVSEDIAREAAEKVIPSDGATPVPQPTPKPILSMDEKCEQSYGLGVTWNAETGACQW